MPTTRFEEADKNLAAMRAQLHAHAASETNATDSPTKFQRWGEERRRLELEVERHTKLVEAAKRADENDRLQSLLAKVDAQRTANAKTAEWLKKEGNELLRRAEAIIQKVAELDVETTKLNRQLPSDVPQIATVDAIARARPALSRKDIAEKQVSLWVNAETGNLVSDQTSVVDRGDGTGVITSGSGSYRHVGKCARRRYRQIEFHPNEQGRWVGPTYMELRIPNFDGPGMAWSGDNIRDAQAALNLLQRDRSEPKREILVEIVPEGPWTYEPRKAAAEG